MNKPIPALDERGEFIRGTFRSGGTVTIFTLDDGKGDEYPIVSDIGVHCSEDFVDIDKLRATVERARKMRPKFPTRGAHDVAEFYKDEAPPARPTFAEALESVCDEVSHDARVSQDDRGIAASVRRLVRRARRATEGQP